MIDALKENDELSVDCSSNSDSQVDDPKNVSVNQDSESAGIPKVIRDDRDKLMVSF